MIARWYISFDGAIPMYLCSLCEALNLSWSIIKNTAEGSSGSTDAARNKFRERFMILFPQDMDGLPDLSEDEPPPMYMDQKEEIIKRVGSKRNLFDTVSMSSLRKHGN
jgi:hypothetical protein